jgi:hypothetical protein
MHHDEIITVDHVTMTSAVGIVSHAEALFAFEDPSQSAALPSPIFLSFLYFFSSQPYEHLRPTDSSLWCTPSVVPSVRVRPPNEVSRAVMDALIVSNSSEKHMQRAAATDMIPANYSPAWTPSF